MRTWTGSWRWIMLVLLAWGTLLFYIGGHLVRDSEQPEHPSRELSKILSKLERLKLQNEELRRMAETLRLVYAFSKLLVLGFLFFLGGYHSFRFGHCDGVQSYLEKLSTVKNPSLI